MTVIPYEQLIELVEQLPEQQQKDLIAPLLTKRSQQRNLTVEEKIQLLHSAQIDVEVLEEPSARRADWYLVQCREKP